MTNFLTALAIAVAWIVFGYLLCVLTTFTTVKDPYEGWESDWTPGLTILLVVAWPITLLMLLAAEDRVAGLRRLVGWPVRHLNRLEGRRDA